MASPQKRSSSLPSLTRGPLSSFLPRTTLLQGLDSGPSPRKPPEGLRVRIRSARSPGGHMPLEELASQASSLGAMATAVSRGYRYRTCSETHRNNVGYQSSAQGTHSDKCCFNLDLSLTGSSTSLGSARRHNLTPAPGLARKRMNVSVQLCPSPRTETSLRPCWRKYYF